MPKIQDIADNNLSEVTKQKADLEALLASLNVVDVTVNIVPIRYAITLTDSGGDEIDPQDIDDYVQNPI